MGTIRRQLAHIKNPMALIRENTGPVLPNMFTWKWLPAARFNVQDPAERCELMGKMLQTTMSYQTLYNVSIPYCLH